LTTNLPQLYITIHIIIAAPTETLIIFTPLLITISPVSFVIFTVLTQAILRKFQTAIVSDLKVAISIVTLKPTYRTIIFHASFM
jgi:hypothetical protein